jgi:hypothetical protein
MTGLTYNKWIMSNSHLNAKPITNMEIFPSPSPKLNPHRSKASNINGKCRKERGVQGEVRLPRI